MNPALPQSVRRTTLPHVKNIYTEGVRVPRRRTEIAATEIGLPARFALHLRGLMEKQRLSSKRLAELMTEAGTPIKDRAVDAWLRGEAMPKSHDLETLGEVLELSNYRNVLPPPRSRK